MRKVLNIFPELTRLCYYVTLKLAFVKYGCPRWQEKVKMRQKLKVPYFDLDPPPETGDIREV